MIIYVEVMPKEGILDPQGKAVRGALHQLSFNEVQSVKVGKRIAVEVDTNDKDEAVNKFVSRFSHAT